MIQQGARLTLEIEKPTAGGQMLARHSGQVVLVGGTIPGEHVVARVVRVGKGVLFADVEEVLSRSPDRRQESPDWRCGGNVLSHVAYPRQLELKAQIIQDAFARIGRLPLASPPEVLGSPETGYRMRARLHVRAGRIGFFREGTHELCDAPATGQLLPETADWMGRATAELQRVERARANAGVGPAVAAMDLAENIPGSERAVHLELSGRVDPEVFMGLAEGLVGLSAQPVGARDPVVVSGSPFVADILRVGGNGGAQLTLRRNVRAFFQGNRFLLEALVQRVASLIGTGPIVDLYAGVGLFGLSLAAGGEREVTLVEGDPIGGADLARNAEPFGTAVAVHRRSVETFLSPAGALGGRRPTSVLDPPGGPGATFIVDPPRTGMSRAALSGMIDYAPQRIVYVSCDVATLARDARLLVDGGWELAELTGIDLFPNTAHVESIAVFER